MNRSNADLWDSSSESTSFEAANTSENDDHVVKRKRSRSKANHNYYAEHKAELCEKRRLIYERHSEFANIEVIEIVSTSENEDRVVKRKMNRAKANRNYYMRHKAELREKRRRRYNKKGNRLSELKCSPESPETYSQEVEQNNGLTNELHIPSAEPISTNSELRDQLSPGVKTSNYVCSTSLKNDNLRSDEGNSHDQYSLSNEQSTNNGRIDIHEQSTNDGRIDIHEQSTNDGRIDIQLPIDENNAEDSVRAEYASFSRYFENRFKISREFLNKVMPSVELVAAFTRMQSLKRRIWSLSTYRQKLGEELQRVKGALEKMKEKFTETNATFAAELKKQSEKRVDENALQNLIQQQIEITSDLCDQDSTTIPTIEIIDIESDSDNETDTFTPAPSMVFVSVKGDPF